MGIKGKTILLAAALCCLLSGCVAWSADDSYRLPKPPAEYENLMDTIAQTKRELAAQSGATVEDVSPTAGANTAAVQLLDMDSDGVQETAVTFLRVVGAQEPIRICFYRLQADDGYRPAGVIMGEGDSIYSVRYADVDGVLDPETGRPWNEIAVSWQMGSNAYYLGLYAVDDGETTELVATAYQAYQLVDLDQDGRMELAVCRVDAEQQLSQLEVYTWSESRACQTEQIALSAGMTAVTQMAVRRLDELTPALCLTGTLGEDQRVIELVTRQNGQLRDLTTDEETGVSRECVEGYREALTGDVNGDGAVDIARPRRLPYKDGTADTWVIDWVRYTPEGRAGKLCTTYHNTADGWYLILPDDWRNVLEIHRSDAIPGQRGVVFSRRLSPEGEPQPFLSVYKLTGANRNLRAVANGRFILAEDSSTVYAASFLGTWNCGLSQNDLLDSFRLIAGSWSGE